MTIAEVHVNFQLAMPQGWTQEEVQDWLNDLLTSFSENERNIVEFEVVDTRVNADPFGKEFLHQTVPANFTHNNGLLGPALFMGGPKLVSSLR